MSSPDRGGRKDGWLGFPRTVIGLALTSLFTDTSSEMIFPLLPAFLTLLGASNAFIGLVEGAAELVSNVLKYVSGLAADRRTTLKPLVIAGYSVSTVMRPIMAFAVAPWHVLVIRVFDRVGKGVRTSPRDALIAEVTDQSIRGKAYGFNRAADHAGAAVGTLLSAALLWLFATRMGWTQSVAMRTVFLIAAVPGLIALAVLVLTPERARAAAPATQPGTEPSPVPRTRRPMPPLFKRALVAVTLFAIANATDAFLLVKIARLGAPVALAPLLWLTLHVIKAATGTTGGRLSDRYGRRNALIAGWLVYAVTWGAIGFATSVAAVFVLTAVYGVSHGLVEGAERALIAQLSGGNRKGFAFGVYNMGVGVAALVASTAFGAVWDRWGSIAAFAGSASFAVLAAAVLLFALPAKPPAESPA